MPADPPDDFGFFVEPAPSWDEVGIVKQPAKRRSRKPKPEIVVKRARAAGLQVTSYTVGDVTVRLGEPDAAPQGNDLDKWIAKHGAH
jgi:hypothetical protein